LRKRKSRPSSRQQKTWRSRCAMFFVLLFEIFIARRPEHK
jgi:hypothetical protein